MVQSQTKEQRRLLATKRYNRLQLSIVQEQAIDLLISGQNDRQVAEALHVHRVSITRWRRYHPGFQASLNYRRRLLAESSQDKLRTLVYAALDALLDDLGYPGKTRTRVALDVFHRGTGLGLGLVSDEETDPDKIVDRLAKEAEEEARYRAILPEPSDAYREATLEDLLNKANEPPPEDPTI
jgi:hypothetical protein